MHLERLTYWRQSCDEFLREPARGVVVRCCQWSAVQHNAARCWICCQADSRVDTFIWIAIGKAKSSTSIQDRTPHRELRSAGPASLCTRSRVPCLSIPSETMVPHPFPVFARGGISWCITLILDSMHPSSPRSACRVPRLFHLRRSNGCPILRALCEGWDFDDATLARVWTTIT